MEDNGLKDVLSIQEFLISAYNGEEIDIELLNILDQMEKSDLISYMYFIVSQLKLRQNLTEEEKEKMILTEENNLKIIENFFEEKEENKVLRKVI